MIVNIRGTSGAGKSHVVRTLMEQFQVHGLFEKFGNRPIGYRLSNGLHIVGRYDTPCGGCDGIQRQDDICRRVTEFSLLGNVLFEGLLASATTGRYVKLAQSLVPNPFVFAFLDTPLETCVECVRIRRAERGDDREFNPKNTEERYEAIQRSKEKLIAAGMDVRDLPRDSAADLILAWLPTPTKVSDVNVYESPRQAAMF